jgi:hypothetical protein
MLRKLSDKMAVIKSNMLCVDRLLAKRVLPCEMNKALEDLCRIGCVLWKGELCGDLCVLTAAVCSLKGVANGLGTVDCRL